MGWTGAKKEASSLPARRGHVAPPPPPQALFLAHLSAYSLSKTRLLFSPELVAALSDLTDTLRKQSSASELLTDSSLLLFMHCLHNCMLQITNANQTISGQRVRGHNFYCFMLPLLLYT